MAMLGNELCEKLQTSLLLLGLTTPCVRLLVFKAIVELGRWGNESNLNYKATNSALLLRFSWFW